MPDQTLPPPGKFGKVVTVHDIPFGKEPHSKFWEFQQRRVVDRADRLVCVSRSTAEDLVAFAPAAASKISVSPAGLDLNVFRPGPRQAEHLASRFQLSVPFFLHVGVCRKRKNPDGILEAVKLVRKEWRDRFEMVFVGPYQVDEPALEYLRLRGEQLGITGHLRFLGDVTIDELVTLYRNSHALVFPSLLEGFGYPPVEALACGTPCIISDEGAVAEVVGDLGLRVNARSAEAIASAMMAVLRGDVPDVSASGPLLAARFGASSVADHFTGIYQAVRPSAEAHSIGA
jgi:glycosyltransferase involved in cell wall biosynthesis